MNIYDSIKKAVIAMPARDILPLAEYMAFTISDNLLTLKAGTSQYKLKVEQEVESSDTHMLLPKAAVDFIVGLGDTDISIEKSGSKCIVKYPNGKLKYDVLDEQWLNFEELENDRHEQINMDSINSAVLFASKILGENEHRLGLQGTYVSPNGAFAWEEALMGIRAHAEKSAFTGFRIPRGNVSNIIGKCFVNGYVDLTSDDKKIQLKSDDCTLIYSKMEKEYNGHTIFEAMDTQYEPKHTIQVNRKDFFSAVQRADTGMILNFDLILNEKLTVKSDTVTETVPFSGSGEFEVSINQDLLKKALRTMVSDEIEIVFYAKGRPIVLRDEYMDIIIALRVKL